MKNLTTLAPRDVFTHLNSTFDRVLADFFNDDMLNYGLTKTAYPKVDVWEKEDHLILEAAVPGLTKDNIKVEWKDDLLSIRASSTNKKNVDQPNYKIKELHRSSFSRSFHIDKDDFNVENINAKVENGILSITIPKTKTVKSTVKKISVN